MIVTENLSDSERIAVLRRRLRDRKSRNETGFLRAKALVTAESLRASESVASWQVRRGLLTRDRLREAAFDYDPLEAFVGRLRLDAHVANNAAYDDAVEYLQSYPFPPGQTGHCELDLSRLMSLGIDGLVLQISGLRDSAVGDRRDVYQSFLHALDGLCGMMENAADTPGLEPEMAADCRWIAHHPPESFRQALQLLWFTLLGLMYGEDVGLVVPGHIDRIPFYAADRDRIRVSPEQAQLLIEDLSLLSQRFD